MNRPTKFNGKSVAILGLLNLTICLLTIGCRQTPTTKTELRSAGALPDLPTVAGPVSTDEPESIMLSVTEQVVGTGISRSPDPTSLAVEETGLAPNIGTNTATPSKTPSMTNEEKEIQAQGTPTSVQRATPLTTIQSDSTNPPQLPTADPTEFALTAPPPNVDETPEIDETDVPTGSNSSLLISTLEFTREQVTVTGLITGLENECILSRLTADEEKALWWPTDTCADRLGSNWQLNVLLGEGVVLDPTVQYILKAWLRDDPTVVSQPFLWDVAGPPGS